MAGLDRLLFRTINGWSQSLDPFLTVFSSASDWRGFRLVLLAILIAYIALRKGRAALLALLAFPVADGLCNLAKHLAPMHRPFQELGQVTMRVGTTSTMGTASSHAANMAAVATVMTLGLGWRWGGPWITLAFLVGVSRVYVGAHYPSQVLLGWSIGVLVGLAFDRAARAILDRGKESQSQGGKPH